MRHLSQGNNYSKAECVTKQPQTKKVSLRQSIGKSSLDHKKSMKSEKSKVETVTQSYGIETTSEEGL